MKIKIMNTEFQLIKTGYIRFGDICCLKGKNLDEINMNDLIWAFELCKRLAGGPIELNSNYDFYRRSDLI